MASRRSLSWVRLCDRVRRAAAVLYAATVSGSVISAVVGILLDGQPQSDATKAEALADLQQLPHPWRPPPPPPPPPAPLDTAGAETYADVGQLPSVPVSAPPARANGTANGTHHQDAPVAPAPAAPPKKRRRETSGLRRGAGLVRLPPKYASEVERRLQAVLDHYDHFGLVTVAHMDRLLSAVLPELYAPAPAPPPVSPPYDLPDDPKRAARVAELEGRLEDAEELFSEGDDTIERPYKAFLLCVLGTEGQRKKYRHAQAAQREPTPEPAEPPPPAGPPRFDDGGHDDLFESPCASTRDYNPAEAGHRRRGDDTDDGEANARRRKLADLG